VLPELAITGVFVTLRSCAAADATNAKKIKIMTTDIIKEGLKKLIYTY
jgi:hypothetical protein